MIYDRRIINRTKEYHNLNYAEGEKEEKQNSEQKAFIFHKEMFLITLFIFFIMILISELFKLIPHH